MKWYITYFYNVRYLRPNQLPLSTAMFPPKWFTNIKLSNAFIDINGVINGITIHELVPKQSYECPCKDKQPTKCCFLQNYMKQLQRIDFNSMILLYEKLATNIAKIINDDIDEIILLVYEKPDNVCSERTVLKKWFKQNGKELKELEVIK